MGAFKKSGNRDRQSLYLDKERRKSTTERAEIVEIEEDTQLSLFDVN